jgi:hypothetical protein
MWDDQAPVFATRLSKKYNTKIYLKEDLNHTGAINNTIGQILVAQKLGKNESLQRLEQDNMCSYRNSLCLNGLECISIWVK